MTYIQKKQRRKLHYIKIDGEKKKILRMKHKLKKWAKHIRRQEKRLHKQQLVWQAMVQKYLWNKPQTDTKLPI